MAIYHLSVNTFSRSKGQSAVAAAAYRAASKLIDKRTGETHNYTRKCGVVYTGIIAPQNAPAWATDIEQLWSKAEASERRKNSTVAREVEVSLPAELNAEQRQALAVALATEISEKHRVPVQASIHAPHGHNDERNHHVHLLFTTRRLVDGELTEKTREWDDRAQGKATVHYWRERWAELANEALKNQGIDDRIDHRSYRDRGIDKVPTQHAGPAAMDMERRGKSTRIGKKNERAKRHNYLSDLLDRVAGDIQKLHQTNKQIAKKIVKAAQRIAERQVQPEIGTVLQIHELADRLSNYRRRVESTVQSPLERSEAPSNKENAKHLDDIEGLESEIYHVLEEAENQLDGVTSEQNTTRLESVTALELKP